ncbi:hypothetical protein PV08_08763 [Exophiala spinifera]|uniref:Carrier domain-containing protein n=1 Tax=Exophiala spinifera TaxID=91928 RepID=A0A0D2BQX8_9EURO|nr:uncharacterized protein PV08_08763 [Exophiala spinifera]KIW13574.1 hypothetical protein PV08_08763 [Exophiala spinifera]
MEPTYFTCDLGQAVLHQHGKEYETVTELVDYKARKEQKLPAVGFFSSSHKSERWAPHILSFEEVQRGSVVVADALSTKLRSGSKQTIALLCPSSPEFLFTWLAIIRWGHAALLIAPQCSPSAIAHLCRSCEVKCLIYDEVYKDLAEKASAESAKSEGLPIDATALPFAEEDVLDIIARTPSRPPKPAEGIQRSDIAYLHHTSGTSTGIPEPIPQSHQGAVGVLPSLDGTEHASFSTTPLYHGGVADLFRAWTSNALIWLFPGKDLPITAANVCRCLDTALCAASKGVPPVKYFSSVPYILQMMSEDEAGLKYLQRMDIVGVGGAALPPEVGDKLVGANVNLISRFGSAECGFLMSSYREFQKDKEWQYLRVRPGQGYLKFEPQEDGLSELVIQAGWPHMAKHNREDGSYATADLFAAHPTIPDAWRYHSRADSQLTLVTGKKFDPAPLEDAIRASLPLVDNVLIFGNGQPHPGALIFRSEDAALLTDDDFIRTIAPVVEKLNRVGQSHARLPRNMLVPMLYDQKGLEKSSKGTILRSRAEERYASNISKAYSAAPADKTSNVSDDDIPRTVRKIVTDIASDRTVIDPEFLNDRTDLFAYGIDSIGCIQIRHGLSRLIPDGSALPLTVVEDQGTISRLSALILRIRRGGEAYDKIDKADTASEEHALMLDLAKRYSTFEDNATSPISSPSSFGSTTTTATTSEQKGLQILLTGPTGSLGSHILHQLLSNHRVSHIHLLVRGSTAQASRERVLKAFSSRLLPIPADFTARTTIWQCALSDNLLGLSQSDYTTLASQVDVILHLAWSVNFLLPLRSFAATHLAGLRNLINFSLSSPRLYPPRLIFCSSVASVSAYHQNQSCSSCPDSTDQDHTDKVHMDIRTNINTHIDTNTNTNTNTTTDADTFHSRSTRPKSAINVPELPVSNTPSASGPTGYARSKWVAEAICAAAHTHTRLNSRISISRVGQLSGATDTGVWSKTEAYPLMLSSSKVTGVLPDLGDWEVLNWLPVDLAARAFVEDALSTLTVGETDTNLITTTTTTTTSSTTAPTSTSTTTPPPPPPPTGPHSQPNEKGDEDGGKITHESLQPPRLPVSVPIPVHHVLNPYTDTGMHNWSNLLACLSRHDNFKVVSVGEWLDALSSLHERPGETSLHPALKLLGFWKGVYGSRHQHSPAQMVDNSETALRFDMDKTYVRMPCLREQQPGLDDEYMVKTWRWIKANV